MRRSTLVLDGDLSLVISVVSRSTTMLPLVIYTDMLGCSISRSSSGLLPTSAWPELSAVKQGGGVTNQLSSIEWGGWGGMDQPILSAKEWGKGLGGLLPSSLSDPSSSLMFKA